MKILVTGAGGFVGGHLVPALIDQGHEVVGTGLAEGDNLRYLDIRDAEAVDSIVKYVQPEWVFHLAGQSSVSLSWREPALTYEVNVVGTHHLFDAIHRHVPGCRVHLAASSDEYGKVPPEDCPLDESAPLRPVSPYAVSRVAGEWIARMYYESVGMHALVTRAFMHIGPGQPPSFATADWARQIAMAEVGQTEPVVRTGNLDGRREFGDVRDVIRAYQAVIEHGQPGDAYNVATGEPYRLGDVLGELISMSTIDIEVVTDPAKLRPIDFPVLYGDASKLKAATGWEPSYKLTETLTDLLEHWREVVSRD
jgi:GDP-4-dehydro-6-deoxy-D-mannose reductase